MVAVPGATAVTRPPPETVAIPVALLLHTPLPVASVSVLVLPMQRLNEPGLIAEGVGLTDIVVVE